MRDTFNQCEDHGGIGWNGHEYKVLPSYQLVHIVDSSPICFVVEFIFGFKVSGQFDAD